MKFLIPLMLTLTWPRRSMPTLPRRLLPSPRR